MIGKWFSGNSKNRIIGNRSHALNDVMKVVNDIELLETRYFESVFRSLQQRTSGPIVKSWYHLIQRTLEWGWG